MVREDAKKRQRPQALVTHHVFLDTDAYRRLEHDPANPLLIALRDYIAVDRVVLHITDITLAEIQRQLFDLVGEANSALKVAREKYARWKRRLPESVKKDIPDFDQANVAEAAFKKFLLATSQSWKAISHFATEIPAIDVFKSYFNREPPFESNGSKEFPDAFVLKVLEKWCAKNDAKMYVVTADKVMIAAVQKSSFLYSIQTLPELLEAIAATETPDIITTTRSLLARPEIQSAIQDSILDNITDLVPVYVGGDLADGEVSEHDLAGDVEVVDFSVLAASEEDVSAILEISTPLSIQIDYEDRSSAFYDKEDGRYYGTESAQAEINTNEIIRVFAKFHHTPPGLVTLKIMTEEFNVDDEYEDYK